MFPLSDPDAEQASNVVDFLGYKALRNDRTSAALMALAEAVAEELGIGRVKKMLSDFCGDESPVSNAIVHRLTKSGF